MKWIKKGLVFKPVGNSDWMQSHAQIPTVDWLTEDILRVYFGTRDRLNRTVTTFVDVQADNPQNVLYIHDKPVLGLGELGCFDDSGAMPSWIIKHEGEKYLYYIGWNTSTTVPYRIAIGIAVSLDNGLTFNRVFTGPIMERTNLAPHFCSTPCVLVENGVWRLWYLSCVRWEIFNNKPEPFYHIKYAESPDGINWSKEGIVCIDFKSSEEAGIARPCLIKENGLYKMWYSYRGFENYRTSKEYSYRIGYAESQDGVSWTRMDDLVGLNISETGWDSEMIAYPVVYNHKGRKYMLYNGNGFGKSGFGYAVLGEA